MHSLIKIYQVIVIISSFILISCAQTYKISPGESISDQVIIEDTVMGALSSRTKLPISNLCFSGGGYRATLFHVGVLWRLNEIGWLPKLKHISGVSGGAITTAHLALVWDDLEFDDITKVATNFEEVFVKPLMNLTGTTIDSPSIIGGLITPLSASNILVDTYRSKLFGDAKLIDLPRHPTFSIWATNLETHDWYLFSRRIMGDLSSGFYSYPNVDVSLAVAASSAYPPLLAPVVIDVSDLEIMERTTINLTTMSLRNNKRYMPTKHILAQLHSLSRIREAHVRHITLADGGLLDNLGSIPCSNNIGSLVSDASVVNLPDTHIKSDWISVTGKVIDIIYARAESENRRDFGINVPHGAIRGITKKSKKADNSPLTVPLTRGEGLCGRSDFDNEIIKILGSVTNSYLSSDIVRDIMEKASIPTRLKGLCEEDREHIINWGYIMTSSALEDDKKIIMSHSKNIMIGDVETIPYELNEDIVDMIRNCGIPDANKISNRWKKIEAFRRSEAKGLGNNEKIKKTTHERMLKATMQLISEYPNTARYYELASDISILIFHKYRDIQALRNAYDFAKNAVELCPSMAKAHMAKGVAAYILSTNHNQLTKQEMIITDADLASLAVNELIKTANLKPCLAYQVYDAIADIYILLSDYSEAAIYLERLYISNPKNTDNLNKLVKVLSAGRDYTKAPIYSEILITEDPKNPQHYVDLAEIYVSMGKMDEAKDVRDNCLAFEECNKFNEKFRKILQ